MTSRVLVIMERVPWPITNGRNIRCFYLLKALSELFAVDLLVLEEERNLPGELANIIGSVLFFPIRPIQKVRQICHWIRGRLPLQVEICHNPVVSGFLAKQGVWYDLLYFHGIRVAPYVHDLPVGRRKPKLFIDYCDSVAMHYLNARKSAKRLWKLIYVMEATRLERHEKALLPFFDRSMAISSRDAAFITGDGGAMEVLPNGVKEAALSSYRPQAQASERKSLCFIGAMAYYPNIDAVTYFVERIFPKLKKKHPNLKFYIIGTNPSQAVKRLESVKGVVVTGFLEDPYPLISSCRAMVAPLRLGGGLQNKILEGMALGKPIVVFSDFAKPISGSQNLVNILTADGEGEFIKACDAVIENDELAARIGGEARRLILSRYTWDIIGERFKYIIKEMFEQ